MTLGKNQQKPLDANRERLFSLPVFDFYFIGLMVFRLYDYFYISIFRSSAILSSIGG
jgi:hypothetical protein